MAAKTRSTLFLSHAEADRPWAAELEEALKEHGYDVYFAEHDLPAGVVWPIELAEQIVERDVIIIVLTPGSWSSRWVRMEYSLADLHNKAIISLVLQPTITNSFLDIYQQVPVIGLRANEAAQTLIRELQRISPKITAQPVSSDKRRVLVEREAPNLLPDSLTNKEYQGWVFRGTEVILPPLRSIPAGKFKMGSDPHRDADAEPLELPHHEVDVSALQMCVYPVTVSEYACAVRSKVVGKPPFNTISWDEQLQRPDHPVVNVTWTDAMNYANWLSDMTEQPWRLLTEHEWEKCAKGGRETIYPWGDRWNPSCANTRDSQFGSTTPVGMYGDESVNEFRLYDMAGNVWEWCDSPLQAYPYPDEATLDTDIKRVVRGGSYRSPHTDVRASKRFGHYPETVAPTVGFRLARA